MAATKAVRWSILLLVAVLGPASRVNSKLLVFFQTADDLVCAGSCVQVASSTCGCVLGPLSDPTEQTDLLVIIGVPSAFLLLLMLALFLARDKDVVMKHKDT